MKDKKMGMCITGITVILFIIDAAICFVERDIKGINMLIICFLCIIIVIFFEYKKFSKTRDDKNKKI